MVSDLAAKFVLVRLPRITGVDLRLFDFDHDLNFYVFFLGPDERVYGRYGGRDGKSAEGRLSMASLRYAMNAAIEAHANRPKEPPPPRPGKPILAEEFAAAKRLRKGECIHCHQVNEFRREEQKKDGTWSKDRLWRYPLPENVGITLAVDQGDLVKSVTEQSPAARAGLKAGDTLRTINGIGISSFADAQFALDRAPAEGDIDIGWRRDGKSLSAKLKPTQDWKRTNITWRPSLLDILAASVLHGDDLGAKEKKALGLGEKRLAFRQDRPIPNELKGIGLREEDVVIGIEGLTLEMKVPEFLAFLRRNYLAGEKITLNVLRDGKRVDLPLTLK